MGENWSQKPASSIEWEEYEKNCKIAHTTQNQENMAEYGMQKSHKLHEPPVENHNGSFMSKVVELRAIRFSHTS